MRGIYFVKEAFTRPFIIVSLCFCMYVDAYDLITVITLNIRNYIFELTVSAFKQNIDIIGVQEYKYYNSELELKHHGSRNGWTFGSASPWNNFVNTTNRGVRML